MDSEHPSTDSEGDTRIHHPDPEQIKAAARPSDPTPGKRTQEDHQQYRPWPSS